MILSLKCVLYLVVCGISEVFHTKQKILARHIRLFFVVRMTKVIFHHICRLLALRTQYYYCIRSKNNNKSITVRIRNNDIAMLRRQKEFVDIFFIHKRACGLRKRKRERERKKTTGFESILRRLRLSLVLIFSLLFHFVIIRFYVIVRGERICQRHQSIHTHTHTYKVLKFRKRINNTLHRFIHGNMYTMYIAKTI